VFLYHVNWIIVKVPKSMVEMEVTVNIDENMIALLGSYRTKDLNSIIIEALTNWTNQNIIKCPIDKRFCNNKEPCNNCTRAKPELHQP
jgi:hypothetical protein